MTEKEWLGSDNKIGLDIWHKKYQHENESFDEWLDRVSGGEREVQQLIKEKKFLFAGRILANRGLDKLGKKITLSNCYVITPPEDNIESIFDCAKKLARTYSYGGGCGVDISKLAPRGATINNAAKETSGAVSFMDLYSMVTGLIGQEGRRGALMISLDCNHPDLEEFIGIKADLNRVTKANISIRITDDFMKAVENNTPFTLQYTREATGEVLEKVVNAKELFAKIAEMNWRTAEPGVLFWDKIQNWNLLNGYDDFEFAGVNPCATITLAHVKNSVKSVEPKS
jgi:ribonucleoside-diphosphate reductase alpha chain